MRDIDRLVDATAELAKARAENQRLRKLLKEARQYVSDAGDDEDGETRPIVEQVLADIDRALTAPE